MKVVRFLALFCALATPGHAEISTEDVFQELVDRHQELDNYFAVYEGQAPSGKSLLSAISFHGPGEMASVHTQLFMNGELVVQLLQATTPELGIVINGQEALNLKDAPIILEKLADIVALLHSDDDSLLGRWSPALSLNKEMLVSQLSITSKPQLPWTREGLPEGSEHAIEGELTIFTTPDGATYEVQTSTGILQRQNYPNAEGDRTLVLKELQTDLSAEAVSEFIGEFVPNNLKNENLRNHPLFAAIQSQFIGELIARVESGKLSKEKVSVRLGKAKPLLQGYFEAIYPPEFWEKALANTSSATPHNLGDCLQEIANEEWKRIGPTSQPEQIKSEEGKAIAILVIEAFKDEFLAFAANKAVEPK